MTGDQRGRVCAPSLPPAPVATALLEAPQRGVPVQGSLDTRQRTEQYSSAAFLANQGVPTLIDATHAVSHNESVAEVIILSVNIADTLPFTRKRANKAMARSPIS